MFQMTKVPLLGVIENMSLFACPHCGKETPIFGGGGTERRYRDLDIPLLGKIPLELETRIGGDEGIPIVVKFPNSPQSGHFQEVARQLAAAQSVQNFQSELQLPSLQ